MAEFDLDAPRSLAAGEICGKSSGSWARFSRTENVAKGLWVYTPIVVPFPHSRLAIAANHLILKAMLWRLRRKLKMGDFQLWTFLPNAVEYVGRLGESMVVYYCIDEWSKFGYLDARRWRRRKRFFAARRMWCSPRLNLWKMAPQALQPGDASGFARGGLRIIFQGIVRCDTRCS